MMQAKTELKAPAEEGLIEACDKALQACLKARESALEVIDKQRSTLAEQNAYIRELEEAEKGLLNQEEFWLIIGTILGAGAVGLAR